MEHRSSLAVDDRDDPELGPDPDLDLEPGPDSPSVLAENDRLQAAVERLRRQLTDERARRIELEGRVAALTAGLPDRPGDPADRLELFGGDEVDDDAFDRFFAEPDPHLDKVRRFLLE